MEKVADWHQWSQKGILTFNTLLFPMFQGAIFLNQSSYKRKTLNIYCKNLKNNSREETWVTKI